MGWMLSGNLKGAVVRPDRLVASRERDVGGPLSGPQEGEGRTSGRRCNTGEHEACRSKSQEASVARGGAHERKGRTACVSQSSVRTGLQKAFSVA